MKQIQLIVHDPRFVQASAGCRMPQADSQLLRWIISQQKQHASGKGCCYALQLSSGKNLIGLISLQQQGKYAELGFWLQPEYWRQGLMTEALTVVLKTWHDRHPASVVTASCHMNNPASRAVLKRVGMRLAETDRINQLQRYWLPDEKAGAADPEPPE